MPRTTPRSLNDNLRVGRLTLPQWVAAGVAGVSLWVMSSLASGVRDPNAHIMAVSLPTILLVAPVLALWRGGVERYPAQLTRYGARRVIYYTALVTRYAITYIRKGARHAQAPLDAARRRHG